MPPRRPQPTRVEHARRADVGNNNLYLCACVLARAAGQIPGDGPAQEEYAAGAVALLRKAWQLRFRNVAQIERDPFFDALRGRADHRRLLTDMQAGRPAANARRDEPLPRGGT